MVQKVLRGKGDLDPSIWFDWPDMQRGIRSASDPFNIKKRMGWLEVRRNFFSVRVANSWNSIPTDLKEEKNTEKFRKKYKKLRAA